MHRSTRTASRPSPLRKGLLLATLLPTLSGLSQAALAQAETLLSRYPSMEGVRVFEPFYFVEFDPVTAMDLVQRTPGFNPQEETGGRGLAGARTNILINGRRPPPKGQSVWQQLSNRPHTSVIRMELIDTNAGASANIDMQGYTQVLNVILDDNNPDYYEANIEYWESGEGKPEQRNQDETRIGLIANLTKWGHELNLRGGSSGRSSRQPPEFVSIDPANPVQRRANPSEFELDNEYFEANGVFLLPADSSLALSARISDESYGNTPLAGNSTAGLVSESSGNSWENRDISGEFLLPAGSGSELLVAVVDTRNTNENTSSFASGASLLSSRRNQESGETAGRVRYQRRLTDALVLRSTLSTAFNYFEGNFSLLRDGVPQTLSGSSNRVEEERHSLNMEADWNWKPGWVVRGNLSSGAYKLEADGTDPNEQTEVKGLFSVAYQPWDRTTVTWESRREIGQLSLSQFLASSNLSSEILQAGAVRLDSERSWEHLLRYDQRFGDRGVLMLTLGRYETENPIRSMPLNDSLVVSQNAFPEVVRFFNSRFEYPFERFNLDNLILELRLDVRDTETRDPVTLIQREVAWARPVEWRVGLRKNPGNSAWSWGVNLFKHVNANNYGVRDTRYVQDSREWNAFVQWEPVNGLRLSAHMDSAVDYINVSDYYPGIRTTTLEPWYRAHTANRRFSSPRYVLQWRRSKYLEVTATYNVQSRFEGRETLTNLATGASTALYREIAEGPQYQLRVRLYNR